MLNRAYLTVLALGEPIVSLIVRMWRFDAKGMGTMLWTLALVLMVLWVLGLVTAHAMGGLIHILLVVAVVVVLIRVIQGRRLG